MDKMDGKTMDIVAENVGKLKELFPEAFTEDGTTEHTEYTENKKIDFEVLKELLGEYVSNKDERYSFTWNGKSRARMIAQTPSNGTLRPCKEESVDWDSTQNIFIEGDNLEVLKLLQKSYHKKVKMIYIDPPYNTGKDFVYKDNFKDNIKNYKEITGQVDGEGRNLSNNPETSGRYHTDWLNMMYPRLKLARNLLKDDGVLFISIDDNEVSNLRKMCDEIFGEENFVNCIAVKMSEASGVKMNHQKVRYPKIKEYLLFYKREGFNGFELIDKYRQDVWDKENNIFIENFTEEDRKKLLSFEENSSVSAQGLLEINSILSKAKRVSLASKIKELNLTDGDLDEWRFQNAYRIIKTAGSSSLANLVSTLDIPNNEIAAACSKEGVLFYYITDYNREAKTPRLQVIFADANIYKNPCDFWQDIKTTGAIANEGGVKYTNGKKPLALLERIIKMNSGTDDLVVDFFAGSASTAHGIFKVNVEKNENRRFIMVQLPEDLEESLRHASNPDTKKSVAESISFLKEIERPLYLTELGKERIRRSAAKIKEENPEYDGDLGFKVFKLDSTNIKPWEVDFDLTERTLEDFISNIKTDRREEDVLYEILLKYGLDLTLPITEHTIAGQKVFDIGMGALIICLSDAISLEVVEGIAKLKDELNPEIMRVVFKDSGFKDDVVKTNAVQILKQAGINDVRSL